MKKIYFRYLIVVLTVLISAGSMKAQVSGYLGKRFVVSLESAIIPSLAYWIDDEDRSPVHFRPGLSLEYVCAHKTSLVASYHYFNTHLLLDEYFKLPNPYSTTTNLSNMYRLEGKTLEIGLNLYLNEISAPLGAYFQPSLFWINSNMIYDYDVLNKDFKQNLPSGTPTLDLPKFQPLNLNTYGLSFSYGKQRIFFDRISFRYSAGFSLLLCEESMMVIDESLSYYGDFDQEFIDFHSRKRLLSAYLMNIKIGIGFVL